ncbi:MAG: hypothetical protein ACRDQT_02440 [Gaiellaceae bacterium]
MERLSRDADARVDGDAALGEPEDGVQIELRDGQLVEENLMYDLVTFMNRSGLGE